MTPLLYRLFVDLYRQRINANILLLLLLDELRLYADDNSNGDDGGGGVDVANQTAKYRKPDCPE